MMASENRGHLIGPRHLRSVGKLEGLREYKCMASRHAWRVPVGPRLSIRRKTRKYHQIHQSAATCHLYERSWTPTLVIKIPMRLRKLSKSRLTPTCFHFVTILTAMMETLMETLFLVPSPTVTTRYAAKLRRVAPIGIGKHLASLLQNF